MTGDIDVLPEGAGGPGWLRRSIRWLLLLLALVLLAAVAAALFLDSGIGRRFVTDRIEQVAPDSGLRIRVGRIDGSIYGRAILSDVRVADPDGVFLDAPRVEVDWRPWQFLLRRRLEIRDLDIPRARWRRLPRLIDTGRDEPLLPDFDIAIARLSVRRLAIDEAVAGRAAQVRIEGRANISSGTADIDAQIDGNDVPDRVRLLLLAVPDQQEFDLDADVVAPRDGLITGLLGVDRALSAVVRGSGNWQIWRGALIADADRLPLARLRLTAQNGQYRALGRVSPDAVVNGTVAQLTPGGLAVDLTGRFANRRIDGRAQLVGRLFTSDTSGQIDLGRNRLGNVRSNIWLREPSALVRNLRADAMRLQLLLDGPMSGPRFEYLLTGSRVTLGNVAMAGVRARGAGVAGRSATAIPLSLTVDRVSGLGAFADRLVGRMQADGVLRWQGSTINGDNIMVRTAGASGRVDLTADLSNGGYVAAFDGALPGLEIEGLGRVDLLTDVAIRPVGGRPTITGLARATMRRLDNGFLLGLAGGPPTLTTRLSYGADGILRLTDTRVVAPLIDVRGSGMRRQNGTFLITGSGVHRQYGPVRFTLDGPLQRPRIDLTLLRPLNSGGLRDISLQLIPGERGFAFTSRGQSVLGPFTASGDILISGNGQTVVVFDRLATGQTVASGRIQVVPGGLAGRLAVSGGGLNGDVQLAVRDGIQRAIVALTARDARFEGPPIINLRRGQIDATVVLDPRGMDVRATFAGQGLSRGTLSIARFSGDAHLVDGRGTVRASVAGARGRSFALQLAAGIEPHRIRVNLAGQFSRRPIRLTRPAVFRRENGGWRLEPAEISYAGSRSQLSGRLTSTTAQVDAALVRIPLSLLDIAYPRLGLGGLASGNVQFNWTDGQQPTGSAQLRILGLTRAGLASRVDPVDVALNAALSERSAAVRAVVRADGAIIGRLQGRASPLGSTGGIVARLFSAPLTAQLRFSGRSDTLWRLTAIDAVALSGPVAVAADVAGTLNNPQITGVLRTSGARLENVQTGTVVTNVQAVGRFDGSRLQVRNIRGETRDGGTVSGTADFDLSAAGGYGMDIRINADRALLIERDDLVARVSGPLRIVSTGNGGEISGDVRLDSGSFRLGRATAAEALPVINVVERNIPADRPQPRAASAPWRLNVRARGSRGLIVTGLGLESDWSTDVTIRGPVTNFTLTGTASLVRGDYMFSGRRFELAEGEIRFTGSTPIDPILDILAVDDVAGIDAQIRVRGSGLRPEISFSSTPALPEDELLSRILFGSSITDISVAEAAQLGVALASLRDGGEGLDPINAIRRSVGLDRLRILPANSEIGAGTSVAAGVNIGRRVYVEVITDGQGYNATRVEYQITRWLVLLGSVSTVGRESINIEARRNY